VKRPLYCDAIAGVSSRRLAQWCQEDVAFQMLMANSTSDFRTISGFSKRASRSRKLASFRSSAAAGGWLSSDSGLWAVARLEAEVQTFLVQAERVDATEDAQYDPSRRGDELPAALVRRTTRLQRIRTAMAAAEVEEEATGGQRAPQAVAGDAGPDDAANLPRSGYRIMGDGDQAFVQA
jgi:hypothetical protein